MSIQPEALLLHLTTIETSQGVWLVDVSSVAETQASGTLLLRLTLETNIDKYGERICTRELEMSVPAAKLNDPDLLADVVDQIRHWIETTDGDGFLELTCC